MPRLDRDVPRPPRRARSVARPRRRRAAAVLATFLALSVAGAACSSDDGGDGAGTRGSTPPSTRTARPAGPAAELTEIRAPGHPMMGAAVGTEIPKGYVQHEYVASGTATAYEAPGGLTRDGRWRFRTTTTAPYRTRVVVRRPADADRSNGTVIVEWLNVSGGIDANPEYANMYEEITRRRATWVGVSAQRIGVEGGPVLVAPPGAEGVAGKGLKASDPARYASLEHPGDGYSFDIFTQVARAARAGSPVTGGAGARYVLAAGESQSAMALVTYYNGVQPLTRAFDGFLVHSRAGVPLPLVGPGEAADLATSIGALKPVLLRDDRPEPVLELQAESDVIGPLDSYSARQPDRATFRLWEVAGTAHADAHLLGPIAGAANCGVPINAGPMHVVAKAALHHLDAWVRTGDAPPRAERIETTEGAAPAVRRDDDGIALGGVRTPPVDVPVEVLSGAPGSGAGLMCLLLGSTKPLPAERIAALYPSRADYQRRYDADLARAVRAGFALEADRDALAAFARPKLVSP